MQTDNKFLDDLAKLAAGAVGTVHGVRSEMEALFRQKLEATLAGLELVRREEFEVVKEMAQAARLENEKLGARIAALEAGRAPAKTAAAKKPRAKVLKPATQK